MSFNRVILMGNLTRDVELKQLSTPLANLTLALNEKRKGEEQTTFVDITLFGRTAEIASEYLAKGSPALIEGRLQLDRWEQDGEKRQKLKVIGERLQMIGRPERKKEEQPVDNVPF